MMSDAERLTHAIEMLEEVISELLQETPSQIIGYTSEEYDRGRQSGREEGAYAASDVLSFMKEK